MSNYSDGYFGSSFGTVHMHNPGSKHEPENLHEYIQPNGNKVLLQGPALRSFRAAEEAATPRSMRRKGKVLPILITGVGYRSYALQKELYDREPGRFANPDGSMHVEGLAVDVDMTQGVLRRAKIAYHLKKRGWFYGVDGEPWHASFRLSG